MENTDAAFRITLPVRMQPEETKDFLFKTKEFKKEIRFCVDENLLSCNERLVVYVTDSFGKKYFCKTRIKISVLIDN